ncbi:multidrug transporter [Clostridium zeae]|uniref:Multidrug transporter n=1 Tax=Clostridium zeae TaxID=2759022 RepID=A0ABQ1E7Q1_9CLOT|nr:MDR family MFS transporter [Clostridium zeae]GFZ30815.1 multidrug transporter [Clostridium zeae]
MEARVLEKQSFNRDIHGKEYNKTLLIIAIMVGSFVSILNQSILSTALPQIMGYFKITASTVQWLTTAFMLVNAIMIPLTALLLEKISTKKLFIFSMLIFGVGTIICAFSPSFEVLLIGRVVQAIGAGIMAPLINTVLLLIFSPEKRGSAMGLYGLVVCFAPAIGPTLAGIIIDRLSWHYLFYMLIPIIILDMIFLTFFMKDVIPLKSPKIDFLSISLSTLGFGAMLYGFSNAGNNGWTDATVIVSIISGAIISALFIWRQLAMKNPMLEMRVFKSKIFTLTTIIGSILNIASVGSSIILPIFLQTILGKSAFTSGLVLLPGALLMAVMMLVSGRLFDKIGAKKLAIPGIILLIIASIPFANLHQDVSTTYITVLYSIRYVGIALVIMPMQTAGMNDLSNKLLPHATAVVNMSKQVAGSIGSAILITVMSNVAKSNAPDKALMKTNALLYKSEILNATIKGINTTFLFVIALTVISLVLSFFLNDKKKNKALINNNNLDQEMAV